VKLQFFPLAPEAPLRVTLKRGRVKAGFDYFVTEAFKVGADVVFVSSQYLVGD
jgi:hypothetical protein